MWTTLITLLATIFLRFLNSDEDGKKRILEQLPLALKEVSDDEKKATENKSPAYINRHLNDR